MRRSRLPILVTAWLLLAAPPLTAAPGILILGSPHLAQLETSPPEAELVRIAIPVARDHGVSSLVSFDYQGEDAAWFLDDLQREVRSAGRADLADQFAPLERARREIAQQLQALDGSLVARLRFHNAPAWLDVQRRLYEEELPKISYRHAGEHQRVHYWLRNHRMFENLDREARRRGARRILVVVGAGHKYFLDELVREAGYTAVDPLDYLPQTVSASSETDS